MNKEIFKLIEENIIKLSTTEIGNLYDYFNYKNREQDITYIQSKEKIHPNQEIPENTYLLGIDLPFWFGKFDSDTKIMIIGIDPLRNEYSFEKEEADKVNNVIIGTPFALHSKKIREGRTKQYWNFIEKLSQKNFVYLTDIYKTFFYTDSSKKNRSYNFYKKHKLNKYADILINEIEIIKPDIIITLGDIASNKLKAIKIQDDIEVLKMVHLSGATRMKHKNKFVFDKLGREKKESECFGLLYAEIINNIIKEISNNENHPTLYPRSRLGPKF
ncbi:uracil-DNA glycosylase family protein [Chryseobacterium sp.]|uniref:uracil-DNA glycosylase family protein n=1 Tax=Chryseobacterium sp. TaxID=1871047 RepID=UPI0038901BFB